MTEAKLSESYPKKPKSNVKKKQPRLRPGMPARKMMLSTGDFFI